MDAKHLLALALLVLAIPTGIVVVTFSQRARGAAFFTMIAATVITDRIDVTFLSHYWYRGSTRGLEFSFVDLLAISVLAGCILLPRPGNSRFYWPASFAFMLLFCLYACGSVLFGEPKVYGVFEISKMLRGLIFFLAAALYVRGRKELGLLVLALCCAVCFEGALSLKQRLIGGFDRVQGSLDHENSLSMYLCLVSPIFIAAATSTLPTLLRIFSTIAIGAASITILLTISRAGVPIFALVMLGATAFCVSWRVTPKKMLATALIVLCGAGILYKTWGGLQERYSEATFKDEYLDDQQEGRGYYLRLAKVIMEDKFFGVGLNNWSFWVSKKYGALVGRPYDNYDDLHTNKPDDQTIADLVWAAPAHNLAALTVGELGVPGLILFSLLWGRWFQMALPFVFKRSPEAMHRLGIGLFFSLCGICLQSLTEWTFRQTHIFLTFNVLVGALAGLCYAKRHSRQPVIAVPACGELPAYEVSEPDYRKAQPCA